MILRAAGLFVGVFHSVFDHLLHLRVEVWVPAAQRVEVVLGQLVHVAVGQGANARHAPLTLDERRLAERGAGPQLGHLCVAHQDLDVPFAQEVHAVSELALADDVVRRKEHHGLEELDDFAYEDFVGALEEGDLLEDLLVQEEQDLHGQRVGELLRDGN